METSIEWQLRLSKEAFLSGKSKPAYLLVEYDSGADGCMPEGWYVNGITSQELYDSNHSYGPYDTYELAEKAKSVIQESFDLAYNPT
jgi:hypothetical protein